MLDVSIEKELYVAEFSRREAALAGREPAWLRTIRKSAIAHFAEIGFPTTAQEEWRFTSVAPIAGTKFAVAGGVRGTVSRADVARHGFGDAVAAELVFVDGHFSPELSRAGALPSGVTAASVAATLAAKPASLEPHLGRHVNTGANPFAALNTALMEDGAFVQIADGVVLAQPIHILFVTTSQTTPVAAFPRVLVVAGRNSQATVVESHVGAGTGAYFSCPVTELAAADSAIVNLVKLEEESPRAYHIGVTQCVQARSSTVAHYNISLGAALTRNDVSALLADEGAEARLDGLYVASGRRVVDNHTQIEHAMPHCASREIYKGVLDGEARAVFNGRIVVRKDAQKTDSKQTNRNLLLSEDATVYTNPQLEIFADDVRCTHGATIGHLDDEALFYMRSRGISKEMAGSLLIYAFASEVIDRIPFDTARVRLERALFARLAGGDANGDPTS